LRIDFHQFHAYSFAIFGERINVLIGEVEFKKLRLVSVLNKGKLPNLNAFLVGNLPDSQ
jgi:hypothetical protein